MRNVCDPRAIRTRELLEGALLQMLEKSSVKQIKISELAMRAKINRVTFYQHYRDISHMVDEMKEQKLTYIKSILENNSQDIQSFILLITHIGQHSQFYRLFLKDHQFIQHIIQHLEWIREDSNAIQVGILKELLIWRDVTAFVGTIEFWLEHGMPYSAKFLANQFYLLYKLEEQNY